MTKIASICDPGRGDTKIRVDVSVEKMSKIEHTTDTGRGDRVDASETFLAIMVNSDDPARGVKVDTEDSVTPGGVTELTRAQRSTRSDAN